MTSGGSRRRGVELEAAIAAAVRSELSDHGYAGVTFEGVAARAQTSKHVLYRRWSTRGEMVAVALRESQPPRAKVPDTGSLEGDLRAMLDLCVARWDHVSRDVVLRLYAEMPDEVRGDLEAEVADFRFGDMVEIVERAVARGELAGGPISSTVVRLPFDLVRHDFMLLGHLPDSEADAIVRRVLIPLLVATMGGGGGCAQGDSAL